LSPNYLTGKQYFNFIAAVVTLHDCQLMDINIPKRIINIKGLQESVRGCIVELEKLLGQYSTDPQSANWKNTGNQNVPEAF